MQNDKNRTNEPVVPIVKEDKATRKHNADRLSELGFLPKEKVDESIPTENNAINRLKDQGGKLGWAVLWLLGVPLPILFILYLLRGCT